MHNVFLRYDNCSFCVVNPSSVRPSGRKRDRKEPFTFNAKPCKHPWLKRS